MADSPNPLPTTFVDGIGFNAFGVVQMPPTAETIAEIRAATQPPPDDELEVHAVPEPATWLLVALGVAAWRTRGTR